MSWIIDSTLTYTQKFCVSVVRTGVVPRHVAFIMDGNRRYAKKIQADRIVGHTKGFDKLAEILLWCRELGITEVTVFAFSIENFNRSREEVDVLMELSRVKFKDLIREKEKLMSEGACVRAIGNLALLPADIRKYIAEAMIFTKDNKEVFLNIAFSYTARDEIAGAVRTVMDAVKSKKIDVEDVSEQLIADCLYTNHSPDPDILIRTSGEVRISDFLLWQVRHSKIHFSNVTWPEFNLWHLLALIVHYQRCVRDVEINKDDSKEYKNSNVQKLLKYVDEARLEQLKLYEAYNI